MSDNDTEPHGGQEKAGEERQELLRKRQSLKSIGRFAAYTAPAMVVLLTADDSAARRHRGGGGGHGNGNGQHCDNPGRNLGWRNNRHSPC